MELYLQAFITVISLMNPAMCGIIFQGAEQGRSTSERLNDASKAAIAVLVILVLAAFLGVRLLDMFGISLDVFSMAGGGVLVWMGFSMLRNASAPAGTHSSLSSLVLFAASPGTITGVISLSIVHTGRDLPVTALAAVLGATLLTWLVMVALATREAKPAGAGFAQATVQSFMGLIVMAMGLQIALKGFVNYFHLTGI
jgi:multiple antibiotic resistance protein